METKLPECFFGIPIIKTDDSLSEGYSAHFNTMFETALVSIRGIKLVVLCPKNGTRLKAMIAGVKNIREREGKEAVVFSPYLSVYQRERLSEENIGFIVSKDIFCLPALLMAYDRPKDPQKGHAAEFSPAAQRLLISIMESPSQDSSVSQLAQKAGLSASSISRYFDEYQSVFPDFIVKRGRERFLRTTEYTKRELFETFEPYMTDPVRKSIPVCVSSFEDMMAGGAKMAGMTALEAISERWETSLIADDEIPTYAVVGQSGFDVLINKSLVAECDREKANAVIQVWKYIADVGLSDMVDPISLCLSLKGIALYDERVEYAVGALMEKRFGQ